MRKKVNHAVNRTGLSAIQLIEMINCRNMLLNRYELCILPSP